MLKRLLPLLLVCLSACGTAAKSSQTNGTSPTASADAWHAFGQTQPVEYSRATIANLPGQSGLVTISGTIVDVCLEMGCWLNIRDEKGDTLFVMTRNHEYFVPRNAASREVIVNGRVRSDNFTVEELRHIAEDARKSPAEIAAITKPESRTYFIADSVLIKGGGLDAPATN